MGASQGAEQQAGARESVGLSAIATFVTAPLDEQARLGVFFFLAFSSPHGLQTAALLLVYHTEELNVDTSKYFRTQRSPGAREWRGGPVFSLFKMERADPSPTVCDQRRKKKTVYLYTSHFCQSVCIICQRVSV